MKKILCNKLEYVFTTDILNINGNSVFFKHPSINWKALELSDEAELTEDCAQVDEGVIATQELTGKFFAESGVVDTLLNRPLVARLRFSDGSTRVWGSVTIPVLTRKANTTGNYTALELSRLSNIAEF